MARLGHHYVVELPATLLLIGNDAAQKAPLFFGLMQKALP